MLTELWQVILFNVLMVITAYVAVYMICDGKPKSQAEETIQKYFLTGFLGFHGARWFLLGMSPFLLLV